MSARLSEPHPNAKSAGKVCQGAARPAPLTNRVRSGNSYLTFRDIVEREKEEGMKRGRILFFALAVLLAVGGLSTAGALDKNTKGELTNWTWTFKCIDEWLVPAFNKVYPNIKIKTVPMSLPETHDKIFAALAAGSGAPDFATILSDSMQKFIEQGGLVDVTDFMNKHKGEFPKYKVQMNSDKDGHVFGVPFNSAPVGIWYRKDILDKYKLKIPETWDEYLNLARTLRKNGIYVTSISHAAKALDTSQEGEVGTFGLLVQQQAGNFFAENGDPTINTKEAVKALKLLNTMVQEDLAANVPQGSPAQYQLMDQSKLFSIITAAWYVNVLENFIKPGSASYGNWRFAKLPAFEKGGLRASNFGGAELCIFKQTPKDKADLAMAFIEWKCTTLEGNRVHAKYGEFPSWIPSWKAPDLLNMSWEMTGGQKLNAVFAEIEPLVPMWRPSPRYTEIQRIMTAKMNSVFVGDTPVEKALAEAQKEAED
jgi:lactose/L-arabinose transport system substrate-binding protein